MKVQVTESQFIETDDIVFAEADGFTVEPGTIVYLRGGADIYTVKVSTDYKTFVDILNEAYRTHYNQFVVDHLTA